MKALTIDTVREMAAFCTPMQIIGKMATTKPADMTYLNADDAKAWNPEVPS